ncbi:uncharacterized protein LOC110430549 [Sorghum bicolor]|uniref:uncharacterized protein LOC110430549 n=1 Tax=Sorghum bicolor TaxID=4558 RepID=UPI000B4253F0|nr:uncharacterized protein LOC110430549 [Sorghum bicolor]|eukprot:XP_021303991.1 uncharacterized protein LOC110430549 [Sorghum bicolor]
MVGVGRICRPSFRCGHRPSPSTLSLPSAAVANSPLSPLLPPCLLLPHNRDGTMDARSDVVASSTERACGGGSSPCRSWINVRWQGEAAKGDLAALQLPPVANPNKMSSQVNPRWSADELDEWFSGCGGFSAASMMRAPPTGQYDKCYSFITPYSDKIQEQPIYTQM